VKQQNFIILIIPTIRNLTSFPFSLLKNPRDVHFARRISEFRAERFMSDKLAIADCVKVKAIIIEMSNPVKWIKINAHEAAFVSRNPFISVSRDCSQIGLL